MIVTMPRQRVRRLRALALLLAVSLFAPWGSHAVAPASAPAVEPAAFAVYMTPENNLEVYVKAGAQGVSGTVRLSVDAEATTRRGFPHVGDWRWERPVDLAAGQSARMRLEPPPEFSSGVVLKQGFITDGAAVREELVTWGSRLILLVDGRSGHEIPEAMVTDERRRIMCKLIRADVADIAETAADLQCSTLIIGLAQLAELNTAQVEAIKDGLALGLGLIVTDNVPGPIPSECGVIREFLPIELGAKSRSLTGAALEVFSRHVAPKEDVLRVRTIVDISMGRRPVLTPWYAPQAEHIGALFLAFDATSPQLSAWHGVAALWKQAFGLIHRQRDWRVPRARSATHYLIRQYRLTRCKAAPGNWRKALTTITAASVLAVLTFISLLHLLIWRLVRTGRMSHSRFLLCSWGVAVAVLVIVAVLRRVFEHGPVRYGDVEVEWLLPQLERRLCTNAIRLSSRTVVKRRLSWKQTPDTASIWPEGTPTSYGLHYHGTPRDWLSLPREPTIDLELNSFDSTFLANASVTTTVDAIRADCSADQNLNMCGPLQNSTSTAFAHCYVLLPDLLAKTSSKTWRCLELGALEPGEKVELSSFATIRSLNATYIPDFPFQAVQETVRRKNGMVHAVFVGERTIARHGLALTGKDQADVSLAFTFQRLPVDLSAFFGAQSPVQLSLCNQGALETPLVNRRKTMTTAKIPDDGPQVASGGGLEALWDPSCAYASSAKTGLRTSSYWWNTAAFDSASVTIRLARGKTYVNERPADDTTVQIFTDTSGTIRCGSSIPWGCLHGVSSFGARGMMG